MKEDEVRAREQLEEVREILKNSKNKIREYNLPVIPESYYIELQEAQSAILNISEQLFYKGDYQKSLELSINSLNRVEPGTYEKLLSYYGNEKD